ncbi:N-acetylneuraminate synthase [Sphingomonas sp. MS122]|uniref:N-acetylneuraminate synthase n=1 Tax=Sphingomonas sp. MS122 TaxID=3412683 RepID=UPI003C2CEBAA
MKTLIIAEAGVNHNGDMDLARRLVRAAADAGADMVKFQTFQASKITAAHAPKADYQKETTGTGESQQEMIAKLELSRADHDMLVAECADAGIRFFSTGFDEDSLDMLVELGIDRIKVPSGEITNLPLLRHIAGKGLPVILSTGMADMADIEAAIGVLEAGGVPRAQITVLHCNTEYPTPMQDVNLPAMRNIGAAFGVEVGYSDHTMGIELPIAAVALGATVIEKHLTLDRGLPGPDHRASLEPGEFAHMVRAIRNIEQAVAGDGIKRPSPSEAKNRAIARKSIVAARDIAAGEAFSADNLTAKRPGTGISPMRWDEVVGRTAHRAFAADELIEL